MGFDDSARPVKSKTIMPVAHGVHRLAAPILGRDFEALFRFADGHNESVLFLLRFHGNGAFRAAMTERIRE